MRKKGLLQKKIRDKRILKDVIEDTDYVHLPDVLEIVEAAKAKFPKIAVGNEVASTETILEIQKWFLEQFGR